jgi:hypothetical protein
MAPALMAYCMADSVCLPGDGCNYEGVARSADGDLGPVCAVPASEQTVEEACRIGYPARHEGRRERILAR